MKRLTAIAILTLAGTVCFAAETNISLTDLVGVPSFSATNSPATLVSTNADASFIVKVRPRVYLSELGCTMLVGPDGDTMSEMYEVIQFDVGPRNHYVIWGARHTGRSPFGLDPTKEYRFLIKPLQAPKDTRVSILSRVLKVWLDEKMLLDRTKKKQTPPKD